MNRFQLFTVLVAKASRYVRKIKTEEMSDFQLKSGHVSCLYYLYAMGEMTATELCEACDEDKANISRSIEYLEKKGYIRPATVAKRYKTNLALTEKGTEVAERVNEKIEGILAQASEGLTEEEREGFYRSFARIDANLEKICKKYGE